MSEPATNLTTPPQPDGPHWREPEELRQMIIGAEFLDYPTAWAIQAAGITHTDARCSAVQTLAFLCDCGAVEARWHELRAEAEGFGVQEGDTDG